MDTIERMMNRVRMSVCLTLAALCAGCYLSHRIEEDREGADASVRCDAMDAVGAPECAIGVPGYWWWDGDTCRSSPCRCAGSDCGDVFGTEAECVEAFGHCRP